MAEKITRGDICLTTEWNWLVLVLDNGCDDGAAGDPRIHACFVLRGYDQHASGFKCDWNAQDLQVITKLG